MVFPDGEGLPAGHGDAREGEQLYVQYCIACHGLRGRGGSGSELAGATESLTSATPDKTIGTYWPYATTLFDFIRRSMPMTAPGTLADPEVYALTAYLLALNGIVGDEAVLDADTLARIEMPNQAGFIWVDAQPPEAP
jgi:cytochrome c